MPVIGGPSADLSGFMPRSGLPVDATNASGVDPSGVAECSTAIQFLLDANAKVGDVGDQRSLRLQGLFNTSSTLVIKGNVDWANAIINYTGTGEAVAIGSSVAGQLTGINVQIGKINYVNKSAGAVWQAGSVGLKVTNVFRSTISYQRIYNFETGLQLVGDSNYAQGGVAYNTFLCGSLNNNKVNQSLLRSTGGASTPFVNQNTFIGGSWSHSDGTYPVSGMRQIQLGDAGGSLNNNLWLNCSLEGQREEYILDCYGNDNMWLNCRWEFAGNNPPIRWRSTAARNLIVGGYQVAELMAGQVIDSGANCNNIIGTNTWEIATVNDGGVVLSAYAGGTTAPLTIMRSDWRRQGDTTSTGYMAKLMAGVLKLKNVTDTSDRFKVDYSAKAITLGAGTSAAAVTIGWGSGTPESVITANPGSLFFDYTGGVGYQKSTGTGNTGWVVSGAAPSTDIQTFAASGTWTKLAGAKMVHVRSWGAGGGGGSGACQPSGTLATGGGGGGSGAYAERWFKASDLTATVAVGIGTGGAGGASVSSTSVGNAGSPGSGGTAFGSYPAGAQVGLGGAAGTAAGAAAGGGINSAGTANGTAGGASSATGAAGTAASNGFGTTGGGGGGGITTGAAAAAGGGGGIASAYGAAAAGGAINTNGTAGTSWPAGAGPGMGGGGGGASVSGAAGNGGAGGNYGAGGGGGGASLNGNASGTGGAGAGGYMIVETYF